MMDIRSLVDNIRLRDEIERTLLKTYFSRFPSGYSATDAGRKDIDDHVWRRCRQSLDHFIPWLFRCSDISDMVVVEVGCGTGSATVGLAAHCRTVWAYDIDEPALEAAQRRVEILGLRNVTIALTTPSEEIPTINQRHSQGVDAVVLYAVLEHCLIPERIALIETAWRILKPGGILVVFDTPSRLIWHDYHSWLMPFAHQLPHELLLMYYNRSPRAELVESLKQSMSRAEDSRASGLETLQRFGLGVSYHEFEVALGRDLRSLMVCDGFEQEIISAYPINLEEILLATYWLERDLKIPLGFTRGNLSFILQKASLGEAENDVVDRMAAVRPQRIKLLREAFAHSARGFLKQSIEGSGTKKPDPDAQKVEDLKAQLDARALEVHGLSTREAELILEAKALRDSMSYRLGNLFVRLIPGPVRRMLRRK